MINRIEIDFALPVELTIDEMRALDRLIGHICDRECPEGWAFWPAGMGSRPNFSQLDAMFLGKEPNLNAPESGEPTWDDTVYSIDCAARELYPEEIERRKAAAQRTAERKARWDSRFAGWLHKRGWVAISWWVADLSIWIQRKVRRSA
jgi:hypothetical protein